MFIIEGDKMDNGGYVRWGSPYRIKHLTSNLYLVLSKLPEG